MLNIELNIPFLNGALLSDVEYSAEYRPEEQNIELYIRSSSIVLIIDLEGEYRALYSYVEYCF